MKLLVIFFDGLGDRPAPELGGLTPAEAAHTPHLDRLASEGINGLQHAKSPGYALGSPLALHLLFGYPEDEFPDRGPLLARARGVAVAPDEVVLAARFSRGLPEAGRLRLVERFVRGQEELCATLAASIAEHEVDGHGFRYVYCGRGDGLLMVRGGSYAVTDTDPLALQLPVLRSRARADAPDPAAAERTARALNGYLGWAHRRLSEQPQPAAAGDLPPINAVITKWAGPQPAYEPFEQRWGMRAASLPDEEVVSGLLTEMGFHLRQITDQDPETDLRGRLQAARELFREGYEFVHLHTKYPDPMSHENDPQAARDAIEALDRAMAWYWAELADDPSVVTVLTTDHTTPSVWAEQPRRQFFDQHGGEPGPITIRGGNVRVDGVTAFGERPAARGDLGHLRGDDFMPVLINAAERTNIYEMRPTPVRRVFRPRPEDLDALEF